MLPSEALPAPPPGRQGWPWEAYDAGTIPLPRGKQWPRISVVTPSFNQGEFLEATLRSVLLQGYPNCEILVLDGGSDDNSVDVLRKYEPHLTFWRSRPDDGQSGAIADGLAMATGEILCWLNSDDIFLPGALHTVAALFARHSDVDVVYGNRLVIDRAGAIIGRHVWPSRLTRSHWWIGQPLAQEATFWRRAIYEKAGGLDRSKFFIMDYDLFFRMWRIGRFLKTPRPLGCLRIHEATKNTKHVEVWQRELGEARAKYALRQPGYLGVRILNRANRLQLWYEELFARHEVNETFGLQDAR
jgi:glycosyltransferase involved in cell wall biosynthesis